MKTIVTFILKHWIGTLSVLAALGSGIWAAAMTYSALATKPNVSAATAAHNIDLAAHATLIASTTEYVKSIDKSQQGVDRRLLSVEATQIMIQGQQDRIEDKLDFIILNRVPARTALAPPAPRDNGILTL